MKKTREKTKLKNSILKAIFLSEFFIVSIGVIYLFIISAKQNREKEMEAIQINIKQSSDFIQNVMETLEQNAYLIGLDEELLFSKDKQNISEYLYKRQSISPNILSHVFFVYDGIAYGDEQVLYDIYGHDFVDQIKNEKYFSTIIWKSHQSCLISNNVLPLIYCVGNEKDYGILVLELNIDYLDKHFQQIYGSNGLGYKLVQVEKNDETIVTENNMNILENTNILNERKYFTDVFEYSSLGMVYTIFQHNVYKNICMYVVDSYSIWDKWKPLFATYFISLGSLLIILYFISYWISDKISKPINKFTNQLEYVYRQKENPLPIKNENELQELYDMVETYNLLIKQIEELHENQKQILIDRGKMEKQALQYKIGPHFLHNTLICVGSLIKQSKPQEALVALQSLLELLAYSFRGVGEYTTLKKEIESIGYFVTILQVRYERKFDIQVNCDTYYKNIQLPKLILQPIIENAIYHGLLPQIENNKIVLDVYNKENFLFIEIIDNGVGFDTNKINLFEKQQSYHVGLINVKKRIELEYGTNSTLKVESCVGKGTKVILIIQYNNDKKEK